MTAVPDPFRPAARHRFRDDPNEDEFGKALGAGCIEVIDGQHNLIYDNHESGRMRRRLPVTSGTAAIIMAWQQHRASLRALARNGNSSMTTGFGPFTARRISG